MSAAMKAIFAVGIMFGLGHRANAEVFSREKCDEVLIFTYYAPYQITKNTISINGKKITPLQLTEDDYAYIANTLNGCRSFNPRIPADTTNFVKQYRRYFDSENQRNQKREAQLRLNAARRELDGYARKILSEDEIKRTKEIGETYPELKEVAQMALDASNARIQRNAEMEEARKKQAAASEKQKEEQAAFQESMPQSCKQLTKINGNFVDMDKIGKANMLAQAGETAQACTLISEVDSSMEEVRATIIQCYKDLSSNPDARAQNVATAALAQAGQLHQGQLKFREAQAQMGCK